MSTYQHYPRKTTINRAGTIASFVEDEEMYIDAKEWANPSLPEEDHYARQFIFGDFHADTHHFIEQAKTRGPKEILCAAVPSSGHNRYCPVHEGRIRSDERDVRHTRKVLWWVEL